MSYKELYFTENDHRRLSLLLGQAVGTSDPRVKAHLGQLNSDLEKAKIVSPEEVPADVITINSRVVVEDMDDREEETWLLCLPSDASVSNQRLSVLSPLGMALLGARAGDTVTWHTRETSGKVRVKEILFQPEAAGCFEL